MTARGQSSKGLRDLDDLEEVFKALAHRSRRHILVVLNARGGRMTAGEIADRFHCSWPTTTRHLQQLVSAGLIQVEPQGRERIYVLDRRRLRAVVGDWLGWFGPAGEDENPKPRGEK